MVPTHS